MTFNAFTVANDYNYGAQWPNGRRIFLPTNKTFEGICLVLSGKFRQKDNSLCLKLWYQEHNKRLLLLSHAMLHRSDSEANSWRFFFFSFFGVIFFGLYYCQF